MPSPTKKVKVDITDFQPGQHNLHYFIAYSNDLDTICNGLVCLHTTCVACNQQYHNGNHVVDDNTLPPLIPGECP